MSKNYIFFKFKYYLLIGSLLFFSNAFSANWYVNDNSTSGDVYCTAVGNDTNNGTSPSTPKLTLNAAYAAAVAGDVIYVDKGTFTGAGNRALIFNKAIKIIGAGSSNTIFTSHTDHRFATISTNNVSVQSLQLFDFFLAGTTGIGQVILVNSNITGFELTNVVVKNNYGDSSNGESIYLSSGSSATFNGLFFSCSGFNGSSGGAVKVDNATLVLKNSVFSQSRNSDGFGGAIQMLGTNPNVNIDKTTFIGNSAKAGGAISQIKGVLVVTNSCFNRNYCQGDSSGNTNGGGHYYSTGTITSATFTNCKFEGAFFCASTNPTEYPCQFSSNISNDGNAISIRGAAGNFTFDTCDFNNSNQPNANFDNGLDFYLDKSGVISVNINNCKFANDMWGGTGTGGSDAVNIWNEDLTSAEFIVTNSGTKQTTANQDGTYGNNYSYAVSTGGAPSGNDLTQSSSTTVTCISGFAGCTTVVNCATETNAPIIISCAPDQTLSSCSGTLPDYRPLLSVFDDCSVTIVQSPAPGTLLSSLGNGTHIITFTVSDQSPNSPDASCSMNLTLSGCNSCSAALSYPNSSVCKTATTQTPTFSPAGGTFTSTSGLTINASTGVITPSTSTAGNYTITYTPNSADPICTATFTITIVGDPNSGSNGTLTICAGTTVSAAQLFAALGGSPTSGGTWSPALAGAGIYTYSVAATSPCTTPATATVTVSDTQPVQPTIACYQTATFNTSTCSWDVTGTQPTQPTATNCWDNYQFNTTSCTWVNNGSQPTQPTATNCWDNYQFNTTSCSWVNNGSQPTQPTATNCWDNYQFNTTSCSWVNNGSQPTQPTATNCWDNYQFNTTSCTWVNNGSQSTQPAATNCWDNYQFNTTSCTWVNNGSQPTQPTATNCWDNYQFNTTSCSWVNNGSQPTQPTATNCWDNYQFNTTSCTWVNNGSQPTQPTATNCWDNYQFNTTSCSWVNNGSQPTQPTATNCWDNYQFNTTSCSWVNNGSQPTQPTATNCWDNYQFNTTSCTWVNNGTQPTQPLISVNNAVCNGSTYNVTFNTNGIITTTSGTIIGNIIYGIAVGTNVVLTATSSNGCSASSTIVVISPADCTNPPTNCMVPTLSTGQGTCSGTGTYSFAFNASAGAVVTASSGIISGNTVIGIAIGTNVTLTATNGLCVTSLVVNSPIDCSSPCSIPMASFSAGICNGTTYSINISNPNNALITSSVGTVTTSSINNIPVGTNVNITVQKAGCSTQIITITSPQLAVTPFAGNDGNISICENVTPTSAELFNALGGTPHTGGFWSNIGNVYTYTVQANSTCSSIPFDTATVTISEIIINNFAIIGECVNENYQLRISPIQNGVTYNWYDSTDTLMGSGTSIIINDNGTYHVESNLNNCKKIAVITIDNSNCIIPKGISPNGDGLNDSWNLSNLNVEKAQIFNRYGMEMFSKSNYTSEWHGQTNSGHILPSATYYYVLTLPNGKVRTGWVYLIREN
jgi:gliding motility-associated-like protein